MVTGVFSCTARDLILTIASVRPAGIVTLDGAVITGLDDLSVTTAPPAGASVQSVTRSEMTLPPVALPEPNSQRSVSVPADCPASAGITVRPIVTNATTTRNNGLRNLSLNIACAIPRAGVISPGDPNGLGRSAITLTIRVGPTGLGRYHPAGPSGTRTDGPDRRYVRPGSVPGRADRSGQLRHSL